jgi:hypothetical protein
MSNIDAKQDRVGNRLTPRQLRLFACACVRRVEVATRGSSGAAIDLAERFADGKATAHQLASTRYSGRFQPGNAAWAVCWEPGEDPQAMADRAVAWVAGLLGEAHVWGMSGPDRTCYSELFRDIAGHFMEPAHFDPLWLAWNDGTVRHLAGAIYDERAWENMPILADALEDAGCQDERILGHCRGGGPHVRGCWVVDRVLGMQ